MKGEDKIKDVFSEKLRDYEVDVNPALWNNIAKQIGGPVASGGLSIFTKTVIIVLSGAAIITSIVVFNNRSVPIQTIKSNQIEVIKKQVEIEAKTILPEDEKEQIIKESKEVLEPLNTSDEIIFKQKTEEPTENNQAINELAVIVELPINISPPTNIQEDKQEDVVRADNSEDDTPVINEEAEINAPIEKQSSSVEAAYSIERLPNIFSPNNDGQHDVFFIESNGLMDFTLVVLDKNNNRVFQTNDPNFRWLGNDYNGNPVPAGNYVYFLTARDINGAPVNQYNTLTISR